MKHSSHDLWNSPVQNASRSLMPGITVAYKTYDQLNSYTCVIALLYDICSMDTNNIFKGSPFPILVL